MGHKCNSTFKPLLGCRSPRMRKPVTTLSALLVTARIPVILVLVACAQLLHGGKNNAKINGGKENSAWFRQGGL